MRPLNAFRARCLLTIVMLHGVISGAAAGADDLPEYRLKAEFLYRFAQFTEWPAEVGFTLNLCVIGPDPFGAALEALQGKTVEKRSLAVLRNVSAGALDNCQIIFVASAAADDITHVLEQVKGRPVLIVADTFGAARRGVTLNMAVLNGHVTFEANMQAAHSARITLSSRLLRLASEVIP